VKETERKRERKKIGRREDHLERGKAAHCSILAWRIPWTL